MPLLLSMATSNIDGTYALHRHKIHQYHPACGTETP